MNYFECSAARRNPTQRQVGRKWAPKLASPMDAVARCWVRIHHSVGLIIQEALKPCRNVRLSDVDVVALGNAGICQATSSVGEAYGFVLRPGEEPCGPAELGVFVDCQTTLNPCGKSLDDHFWDWLGVAVDERRSR